MFVQKVKSRICILGAIILSASQACNGQEARQQKEVEFPKFSSEGHRGARGLYPENTIKGMLKTIDLGVTTLEMDLSITKDKQVVLSHDPYLNPKFVLNPDGTELKDNKTLIYSLNYEELRQYDAGSKPHVDFPQQENVKEYKPLLSDLIDAVEAHTRETAKAPMFYNIETKSKANTDNVNHPEPQEFVDLVMAVVNEKGIADRVVIQSFDFRTLQVVKRDYPHMKTSLLTSDKKKTVAENVAELGFVPFIYSPNFSLVDEALVAACHAQGMKIIPWTANTEEEIARLRGLGVDGIISDYPNLLVR